MSAGAAQQCGAPSEAQRHGGPGAAGLQQGRCRLDANEVHMARQTYVLAKLQLGYERFSQEALGMLHGGRLMRALRRLAAPAGIWPGRLAVADSSNLPASWLPRLGPPSCQPRCSS